MVRWVSAVVRVSAVVAAALAVVPSVMANTVLSLESKIAASADDAEQTPTGFMRLTSSDLEMVEDDVVQTVGLRFTNLALPPGATIVDAWVRFSVDESTSVPTTLTLRAHATDDAPAFMSLSGDLSGRPLTSAAVSWTPQEWSSVGASGPAQTTPGLAPIVQEIVDRPGWSSGGALALIITGSGKRVAAAWDDGPATAAVLHVDYAVSSAIFERRIAVADDDVEESHTGSMRMSSSDLELVEDGGAQTVGLRWRSTAIPAGVTITRAWVQFQTDETSSVATNLVVRGEDVDDSSPFASAAFNLSSRKRTTASVAWSPPPWTMVGEMGPAQRTPDLSAVIQAIIDRPGWASGQALTLIINGSGHRVATAFEGNPAGAALLHVEYASNLPPDSFIDTPAGDVTVTQGDSVTFTGSGVDPDAGQALTYHWDFGGGAPSSTAEDPGPVVFSTPGVFTVTFTVTDALGFADPTPATRVVMVLANQPPQSVIEQPAGNVTIYEGEAVTFAGNGSDPDGHLPLSWRWTFGGGLADRFVEDPGPVVFPTAGDHTVTFTAIDARGLADPSPATVQVTVLANQPPQSVIDQPAQDVRIPPGGSVVFAGSGSDPDGHLPLTWRWTFGGAAPDAFVEDPGAVTFPASGVYTVTFTAIDARGLADPTPATRTVRVNAAPAAVLQVAPGTGNAPLSVVADASASSDPDGSLASWTFDFGDGTVVGPQTGATASHQYAAGEWTATVTVVDSDGASAHASRSIVVAGTGGGPNLVGNPSFESGLSGWGENGGATLLVVPGGFDGAFSLECTGLAAITSFGVNDSPNWVSVVPQAGARYLVSAWVRSDTARGRAKIRVREYLGSDLVKRTVSPEVPLSPTWSPLAVDHVTQLAGTTLDIQVLDDPAAPGEVYLVDNVRITPVDLVPARRAWYVAPWGSDGNPGTFTAPFRTIQYGVARLAPGDRLILRGGTYRETVTIARQGTPELPIVIQGYGDEQVVIDTGVTAFRAPGNSDWELYDASIGEYRSVRSYPAASIRAYLEPVPGYENGRVELVPYASDAAFRATTDQYVNATTPFYVGPGLWRNPADGRIHVRLSKTSDMRAYEARYGTVIEGENADPRAHAIHLSQASRAVIIDGSWLTLRNVTVGPAWHPIELEAGAHHIILDGLTVWKGDTAISADKGGAHDITVTNSRLLGDSAGWIFWSDRKNSPAPAANLINSTIDIAGGAYNWEISFNLIRGGHDLIGLRTDERDIVVHHNRLENCNDDALEIEGDVDIGRIEVFENFFTNCLIAVAPGQGSQKMTGPLHVYRNVMAMMRSPAVNRAPGINGWNGGARFGYEYMFKHGTSADNVARNTHYYHNTMFMIDSAKGFNTTPRFPAGTTVSNNLMVVVNGPVHGEFRVGHEQIVDGNLYWRINTAHPTPLVSGHSSIPPFRAATGLEMNGIGDTPGGGTDPLFLTPIVTIEDASRALYWTLTRESEFRRPLDFRLGPASPAIDAGVPLRAGLPDSRHDALPDIGAIPFGAPTGAFTFFPFDPAAPPRPRAIVTATP